jgi:hypothetical protein
VWDDRPNGGELSPYVIHYHLADDTVEVKEVNTTSAGRETFPVFLKRQRLVKNAKKVVGSLPGGGEDPGEVYELNDFGIGKTVSVLNRP